MVRVFQEQNVHVKGKQNAQKHLEILKQCGSKSGWGLEIFKQQEECIATPLSFAYVLSGLYLALLIPWFSLWQSVYDI